MEMMFAERVKPPGERERKRFFFVHADMTASQSCSNVVMSQRLRGGGGGGILGGFNGRLISIFQKAAWDCLWQLNDTDFVPDVPKKTIPGPVAAPRQRKMTIMSVFPIFSYSIFGLPAYILGSIFVPSWITFPPVCSAAAGNRLHLAGKSKTLSSRLCSAQWGNTQWIVSLFPEELL